MKVKLVSDLHLECSDVIINNNGADVLILAGDIIPVQTLAFDWNTPLFARFERFLDDCSRKFPHVLYVAGNHEYFNFNWNETITVLENYKFPPNVQFMENDKVIIDDVVFIGGTLWTDCNQMDPITMFSIRTMINDYYMIRNEKENRNLLPIDTIIRHRNTLKYFDLAISSVKKNKKVVVITHHTPSFESIPDKYKDKITMNGGYASDLSAFILDHPQIKLWTCGHTHEAHQYNIGDTLVACNPRGYVTPNKSEITNWDPNLIIEV